MIKPVDQPTCRAVKHHNGDSGTFGLLAVDVMFGFVAWPPRDLEAVGVYVVRLWLSLY